MDSQETKRTVPVPSVGADGEQPISKVTVPSIAEEQVENNPPEESMEEILRELQRTSDPAYLPTVSMNELYRNVYQSRPPVIDGLLYPGTYLFAGAPKVGKSFLMAQLAYHVSRGLSLWGYTVHKGTVLYLALEDDHRRLQERMFRMFGMDGTLNRFWMSSMLPILLKCSSSRIFARRSCSSELRFLLPICKTSIVVLLFYTTTEVYTILGIVLCLDNGWYLERLLGRRELTCI